MKRTRTPGYWRWLRLALSLSGPCSAALVTTTLLPADPVLAQDSPAANAEDSAAEQADPATKKLLSANGKLSRGLYKLAAAEFEAFLQQHADHPEATAARYALAVSRYRLSDFDQAVPLLAKVLQDGKFAQRDEALAVLGHCHLSKGEHDKALAAFDELLAKHAQSKHAEVTTLNRAQVLYLAGKLPEASAAAETYLKNYKDGPNRDAAMYFLALSQRGLEKNDAAADTLSRLLSASPDTAYKLDATLLLGQALEAQGKLGEAAERYRQVVQLAPAARKPDGHYSLGVVLYKQGDYDGSARELLKIAKDHDSHPYAKPALLQLGRALLAGGKVKEARQIFDVIVRTDPERANDAKYGLAQADMAEAKWQPARATLDQLAALQPAPANLPQILLDRAVAATELGKFEQAAAEFEQFRKQYPQSPQAAEATYRQAFALHKLGKFAESRALSQGLAEGPANDYRQPAAELDAENLFLLAKYPEASKAFAALLPNTKDDDRKLRFGLRLGQSAYFGGDFARAAELLKPLADNEKVSQSKELQRAILLYGDALLQQGQYPQAAEALLKYLKVADPADRPEPQFKFGLAQVRAGNAPAAEQALAQVAAGPTDNPWVVRGLFELGQLQYKQDKKDKAAEAMNKVLAAKPPAEIAAPAMYLLGWTEFDAKRHEQAADRWAKMIAAHPDDPRTPDARFQRGIALKEAGKHHEALAAFQEYVSKHPGAQHATRARQLAAASMQALGKNDEAMQALARLAGDRQQASDTVLYDLAWSQRAVKDTKGAAETYRRFLKDHSSSKLAPAVRNELAEFLYADKGYEEAAKLLEAVVDDASADAKTRAAATYRLGWCYEKLNQPAKSAATFLKFAEANPDDPLAASALLQAGLSLASQGKYPESASALSRMLQRFGQHEQASVALLKLGEVQAEMGDHAASLKSFTDFLQKYGKDPFAYRAHFGVGWANEQTRQYDAARRAYQQAIDATNTETAARAQFQIGETYFAEGKFEEAVAALLAVEDVYAYPKWSAKALLEAGRAFEQLKQTDQARRQYAQVAEKYKDAPEAALARERLSALPAS